MADLHRAWRASLGAAVALLSLAVLDPARAAGVA